jgi:arabinose operon protein AraL
MNRNLKGVILDLDGTVYRGNHLLTGALSTIQWLQNHSYPLVYISNKPLESRSDYAAKLTRLGIPTRPENVIHSSLALVNYLENTMPGATIFAIGEKPLLDELSSSFRLSEEINEIEAVVASFDRTFDYNKLNTAFQAIKKGARFFATNADVTCPVFGGEIPDAGAVIAALEACSGQKVEMVAGKPSPMIIKIAINELGVSPESCIVVGDRLETDILMGIQANISTGLVLTGVTCMEELERSPIKPDFILQNLGDLPEILSGSFHSK